MSTDTKLLAAENAELKEEIIRTIDAKTHWLRKLVAAQARINVLREALEFYMKPPISQRNDHAVAAGRLGVAALATPDDTAELDALIADAARLDALEYHLFEHQWNGVVGEGAKTYWRLAGNYRHTMQHMVGETFREAIDAMKEATP